MDGFGVETDRLRQLSATFDQQASTLAARTAAFASRARNVDAAFGVLGASDEVYNAYISKLDEFLTGLDDLRTGLARVATALSDDADVYDLADALTASRK